MKIFLASHYPAIIPDQGVIAVSSLGYPIYGPTDEFGQILTGKDLDECGGRVDGYGKYKYHITMDQPNFMYCLKGQV